MSHLIKKLFEKLTQNNLGRCSLAFGLGSLCVLAFPPFSVFPLLFISFPAWLKLLERCNHSKQAFTLSWLFGFGYFGWHWFMMPFTQWHAWYWLPVSVPLPPAILALLTAVVGLIGWRFRAWPPLARILLIATAWSISEWIYSHLAGGLPWAFLSYTWANVNLATMQLAAFVGSYGLSFITAVIVMSPYLLVSGRLLQKLQFAGLVLMLGVAIAFGYYRLTQHPTQFVSDTQLRLVQLQSAGFAVDFNLWKEELVAILDLVFQRPLSPNTHVILPETAVSYLLSNNNAVNHAVLTQHFTPHLRANNLFITGINMIMSERPYQENRFVKEEEIYYQFSDGERRNTLVLFDGEGQLTGHYQKTRLVPFTEDVPDFIDNLFALPYKLGIAKKPYYLKAMPDYGAGQGIKTLETKLLPPFSPLICYEILFPGAVVAEEGPRAEWILLVSSDSWYKNTTVPDQLFAIAQFRAIEEGLPVVRSAHDSQSGVIDAFGRIIERFPKGKAMAKDVQLPTATTPPPYARYGDKLFALLLLIAWGVYFLQRALYRYRL